MAGKDDGAFREVALWLRSRRPPVPEAARTRLRAAVAAFQARSVNDAVDGWSTTLTGSPTGTPHALVSDTPSTRPAHAADTVRCLLVTDVLDTGGLDEFVAFLARRLPSAGFSVTIAKTGVHGGGLARTLRDEGFVVHETPDASLLRQVMDEGFDVVSAHSQPDWANDVAADLGVPLVETLHGLPTPIGTDWGQEPARAARVTAFVAVSEMVRRQYVRGNPGFDRQAVVVVPNGLNDSHRPPAPRDASRAWLGLRDEYLLVTMARLTLQKNTFGLVRAFFDFAGEAPDAHLLLAGRVDDPIYAKHVIRLRDRQPASIARRLHIRGNTPFVSQVLAAADLFVMDSFFEGWSLASMEALSDGLPVVMSDVGGAQEQIGTHGGRGLVVANPLGDPESATWEAAARVRFNRQPNHDEFVQALRTLYARRSELAQQRETLARECRPMFDPQDCVDGHAATLRRAIAGRTTAGFVHA